MDGKQVTILQRDVGVLSCNKGVEDGRVTHRSPLQTEFPSRPNLAIHGSHLPPLLPADVSSLLHSPRYWSSELSEPFTFFARYHDLA